MGELLAKPDKTLLEHLIEVYRLGKALVKELELESTTADRALLACLMHDIGKATESFQKYIKGESKKSYPHALASLPFVLITENILFGEPFAASGAVLSHHSPLSAYMYEGWTAPRYSEKLPQLLDEIFSVCDVNVDSKEVFNLGIKLGNPSDLIHASAKTLLNKFQEIPSSLFASVKTVLHLADWLASGKFDDPAILFLKDGSQKLKKFVKNRFELRDFQLKAAEIGGENLRLRAPTGSGKTEALLLWAGDSKRIIYLLPTQATANAMWRRLSRIYGDENVGISHGRAKYVLMKKWKSKQLEDEPPLDYKLFASVFAKPVVVATLDQFLMGFMNGRHWEERQTLSSKAAIIIDEIHTYEPYTLGILKYVLDSFRLEKVALASATLPNVLLELFGSENLVIADDDFWSRRRYKIKLEKLPIESCVGEAIDIAKSGGRVLIITNTVNKAQELFDEIKARWGNTLLLHSRFIYRDRLNRENLAIRAKRGTILISTQIVEVSLDISYDVLFTELAPVDALIQRMGRVNRKGEKPPADIVIFTELDEPSVKVYGEEIINVSKHILGNLPEIPEELDFVHATEELYAYISSRGEFNSELESGRRSIKEIREHLGNFTIDLGDEEFRTKFVTRKGIFSIDVIPEQFTDEAYKLLENGERWRLVELTVPVHGYWVKAWPEKFTSIEDIGYPMAHFEYDSNKGLLKPDDKNTVDIEIW